MEIVIAIIYNNRNARTQTVTNTGTVWNNIEHPNNSLDLIYANLDKPENIPGGAAFINAAKINVLPTVLFLEKLPTQYRIITRLTGQNLSVNQITKIYLMSLNNKFAYGSTGQGGKTGIPNEGGVGFGLLDFNLPSIFWKGLVVYAGYKTATAKKDSAKVAYGALTAASTIKAF